MKIIRIIVLVIFSAIILMGCSSKQDELLKLEARIKDLESISETNSEITDTLEEIISSIYNLQEDINLLKSTNDNYHVKEEINILDKNLESIKTEVNFLKIMLFGRALFDRNTIQVGDNIAGMEVVEINENEGLQFLFSGQKKVTGHFEIISNDEYWGDIVTFHIDDKVSDILPREIEDYRTLWFRFINHDHAVELLNLHGKSGTVTIIIDQYCANLLEGCVINYARIIGVESE